MILAPHAPISWSCFCRFGQHFRGSREIRPAFGCHLVSLCLRKSLIFRFHVDRISLGSRIEFVWMNNGRRHRRVVRARTPPASARRPPRPVSVSSLAPPSVRCLPRARPEAPRRRERPASPARMNADSLPDKHAIAPFTFVAPAVRLRQDTLTVALVFAPLPFVALPVRQRIDAPPVTLPLAPLTFIAPTVRPCLDTLTVAIPLAPGRIPSPRHHRQASPAQRVSATGRTAASRRRLPASPARTPQSRRYRTLGTTGRLRRRNGYPRTDWVRLGRGWPARRGWTRPGR